MKTEEFFTEYVRICFGTLPQIAELSPNIEPRHCTEDVSIGQKLVQSFLMWYCYSVWWKVGI